MNPEHLKLFIELAKTSNFSRAGRELGLSPAVTSAHINKLETSLGVRLLHRTTRSVTLTEDGQNFLPHAEDVLASIEAAGASVGAGQASVSGRLRVTAPASFGRMHLMPALKDFLDRYPDLSIDFRFSDTIVDLVEGGFDIAIRNAPLKDSTLIARKLASDKRIICASPEYLDLYGAPKHPRELTGHQCLNLYGLETWPFYDNNETLRIKTSGRARFDNGEALRIACVDGLGIAIASPWSVYKELKQGQLQEILADFPMALDPAIWAVYPSSRQLAPKVRAFIDYFSEYFGDTPYWQD